MGGDKVMENHKELYKLHKQAVKDQGRKPQWVAQKLDCSYSLIHKYLNGHKMMSKEKVEKLHSILIG